VDDLHALDAAVRELRSERSHRNIDKGFSFAWWDGPSLPRELEDEIQVLFSDILVALAGGITGIDIEHVAPQLAPKRGGFGLDSLAELFLRPRAPQRLQDASIALLEGHVAPWDPRLAVVATWNMACAVALRERLREATVTTLEAAWRRALGDPPA
jgi:hypothetical protein